VVRHRIGEPGLAAPPPRGSSAFAGALHRRQVSFEARDASTARTLERWCSCALGRCARHRCACPVAGPRRYVVRAGFRRVVIGPVFARALRTGPLHSTRSRALGAWHGVANGIGCSARCSRSAWARMWPQNSSGVLVRAAMHFDDPGRRSARGLVGWIVRRPARVYFSPGGNGDTEPTRYLIGVPRARRGPAAPTRCPPSPSMTPSVRTSEK